MLRFIVAHLPWLRPLRAAIALCLLSPATLWAQEAALKKADGFFDQEDYHTAGAQYEQILRSYPKSGIAKFKAGICYLYTGQADRGLSYLREARQLPLEVDPYYYFWLGKAFHLNMRIDSALINYRRYLNTAPKTDAFRKGTENLIAQAHRTESYFLSPDASPLQPRNLGENINSPYTERNPLLTADGKLMVFASRRPLYPEEQPQADGEFQEKMFIAQRQPDGTWSKAAPLLAPADRKSWYLPVQMLDGGQRILLLQEGAGKGGFFEADRQGDTYDLPSPLDLGLSAEATGYDVTFSPDLKTALYSKLNRNTGDLDLYQTRRQADGDWTKALRLPATTNSLENEVSPLLLDGGRTLVFGSKGRDGLGGYDLYRCRYDDTAARWGQAENLGLPYNSPGNDIFYAELAADGKKYGYLCTSRPRGLGEADIYELDFTGVRAEK